MNRAVEACYENTS